jgi:1-acyl-sn-glycerol-3-phosphate acyltransferase
MLGLRIEVIGAEHIPTQGPAVLASNHVGYLDFTFMGLAASHRSRLVRFMAKRSIFDNPIAGPLMRNMGHIRVDRHCGAVAYREADRALRDGQIVGIYPEATISRAWTLKPFKLGAATLAVKNHAPLLPVVVWGGHRVWSVDGHRSLRRGIAVTVLIGEPILPTSGADVAEVNAELRARMQALLDEAQIGYPEWPHDDKDLWWLPAHLGGTAPTPQIAAELDRRAVARADSGRAAADAAHR